MIATVKRWLRDFVVWTWQADYRTWAAHSVLTFLPAFAFGLPGALCVGGFYAAHEQVDNALFDWLFGNTLHGWLDRDRIGDILGAVVGLTVGLLLR